MKYNETIEKYFHDARYVGEFVNEKNVVTGVAGSKAAGEMIQLQLKIENGKTIDVRFKAHGSVTTIAAAAYVCEFAVGKAKVTLSSQDITKALDLPPTKLHSALLAEDALVNCS